MSSFSTISNRGGHGIPAGAGATATSRANTCCVCACRSALISAWAVPAHRTIRHTPAKHTPARHNLAQVKSDFKLTGRFRFNMIFPKPYGFRGRTARLAFRFRAAAECGTTPESGDEENATGRYALAFTSPETGRSPNDLWFGVEAGRLALFICARNSPGFDSRTSFLWPSIFNPATDRTMDGPAVCFADWASAAIFAISVFCCPIARPGTSIVPA